MSTAIKKYPLLFSYRDLVAGKGFVAGVVVVGRVLLDMTGDECWMYGVQPGGIAGGGPDRNSAFCEFKRSYLSVLYDLAIEAHDFGTFKAEVEKLFGEVNDYNAGEWDAALVEVRRSGTSLDGIAKVKVDSQPCGIRVVQLDMSQVKPRDNQFGEVNEAA
jgi:hypothetical protein